MRDSEQHRTYLYLASQVQNIQAGSTNKPVENKIDACRCRQRPRLPITSCRWQLSRVRDFICLPRLNVDKQQWLECGSWSKMHLGIKHNAGLSHPVVAPASTKLHIYNATVLSVLLYGAEMWPLTKNVSLWLDGLNRKVFWLLLNTYWWKHIPNVMICALTQHLPASHLAGHRQVCWYTHILYMLLTLNP